MSTVNTEKMSQKERVFSLEIEHVIKPLIAEIDKALEKNVREISDETRYTPHHDVDLKSKTVKVYNVVIEEWMLEYLNKHYVNNGDWCSVKIFGETSSRKPILLFS